jgi:membrane protein implicated in regulation of membrane protease activity
MATSTTGQTRFKIGKKELNSTLKVFAWSFGSALVVFLLGLLNAASIPVQFQFLVPLANTVLYAVKEWISDNH